MPQTIFFDESGFTGNNLLHPGQAYFAYASVATDNATASDFVLQLISTYRIDGNELKGKNLLKFNRGRKAVDELLRTFQPHMKISISNKKFALAGKLFEYVFEPTFSDINSLFYGIGFHQFIANVLYVHLLAQSADAEHLFADFEHLMRTRDEPALERMFSSPISHLPSDIMTLIREFAAYRMDDIRAELESVTASGVAKWILDLSQTSLFTLLSEWSEQFEEITAICDRSKPLEEEARSFDAFIGGSGEFYTSLFGQRQKVGFNLSGPLMFMDSKQSAGIQVADVAAAAAVFAFTAGGDEHADRWRELIVGVARHGNVLPDKSELHMCSLSVQRNVLLLQELHRRAAGGLSVIDGMTEYVRWLSTQLQVNPVFR